MEVRARAESSNQLGIFAIKEFAVGDVICEEKAPLLRLSPLGLSQEERLLAALSNDNSNNNDSGASAASAKKDDNTSKPNLWQSIVVPPSIAESYQGTFKGMVQAALCWIVLYQNDKDDEKLKDEKQKFLKLYAPSLKEPSETEVEIVDIARKACKYLCETCAKIVASAKEEEILSVMLIWTCNSFEQGRVYMMMSRCNHSCNPNAVVQPVQENNQEEGQCLVAAAPIAVGDEICISYLGLLLYAERSVRQEHLQQTKHFTCFCTRCCCCSTPDVAASIPCFQCHERVGRQLDEDTQYDDEQTVNYVAPQQQEGDKTLIYHCTACQTHISLEDKAYAKYVLAGQKVVEKTLVFLRDYQNRRPNDDNNDDDEDQDEVQEELIDQHIRMASSVLGAKHWTTNLLLLLQVDHSLQTLHGAMLTEGDSKSSSSPDLESIAATVDSLERIVRFVNGLALKIHMGHVVGDSIILLARALVALGDTKSQTFAAEWLDKIANDYVRHFASPGVQKVVQALQTAHQPSEKQTSKPPAKKAKR